jgi:hypothetical protein
MLGLSATTAICVPLNPIPALTPRYTVPVAMLALWSLSFKLLL